jgi:hypothetical protein
VQVLLDEGVPEPLSVILAMLEPAHTFRHVNDLGWMGINDPLLFERAAAGAYEVIVALDRNQLTNATEWRALKKSRLPHVSINKQTQGARGQMRILASLAVAMPRALDDLGAAVGGQVVEVSIISDTARHTMRSYREHERMTPSV